MRKSISVKQKKRGRPATGHDPLVGIRLPPEMINQVEEWSKKNGAETRSEGIRRLIERGLASEPQAERRRAARVKASAMAGEQIDRMLGDQATTEEGQSKKRRLIKGPKEFRGLKPGSLK